MEIRFCLTNHVGFIHFSDFNMLLSKKSCFRLV